jgi:uncharacterized surface protein with fasciclin (FAS1) repeats
LKPENKKMLQTILTYHVVAGKMNGSDMLKSDQKGSQVENPILKP